MSSDDLIQIGRRTVRLTHPERVLYPRDGVTKADLARYYVEIGDVIVPHLRDRPFTLKRYPHGIDGQAYFHKQAPKGKPSWIPTRQFRTWPRAGESRLVDFTLVNETAALVWMVQMNCVDMNAWYSRVDKPDRPDYVVFDLDPPESRNGFAQAIRVAHLIREALRSSSCARTRKRAAPTAFTCWCRSHAATPTGMPMSSRSVCPAGSSQRTRAS